MIHGLQTHIRVYTEAGPFGEGEATDASQGAVGILRMFCSFLIGRDPLNVEAIWEHLRTSGIFAGAQGGQYITALTGLEIALWDLAGKALDLPIYRLLGGKSRDRVRICAWNFRRVIYVPKFRSCLELRAPRNWR